MPAAQLPTFRSANAAWPRGKSRPDESGRYVPAGSHRRLPRVERSRPIPEIVRAPVARPQGVAQGGGAATGSVGPNSVRPRRAQLGPTPRAKMFAKITSIHGIALRGPLHEVTQYQEQEWLVGREIASDGVNSQFQEFPEPAVGSVHAMFHWTVAGVCRGKQRSGGCRAEVPSALDQRCWSLPVRGRITCGGT